MIFKKPQTPLTPEQQLQRQQQIGLALSALSDVFGKRDPIAGTMQRQAMLQQQKISEQEKEKNERIKNSAAQHLKNLGANESQIALAKDDVDFSRDVLSQQYKDTKETALIENTNYVSNLRNKLAVETDPLKKQQIQQQIDDMKGLGGMLRYDPTLQYEIEQSKRAAQQGLDLGEKPMGAGELKTDESFGTFYTEYNTKGRGATNIANLERLQDAEEILKIADQNNVDISGVTAGMISGRPTLEAFLNEQGFVARERMEAVIQQSLRATLGAQFGEREGEQFIRRGYNPSLSPSENLERLIDLRSSIEQLVESEKDAVEYYENNNKTLRGYKGKMYNVDSFSRDLSTDYKQDVFGLSNDDLKDAYLNAREGSIWESAIEKEIQRRNKLGK